MISQGHFVQSYIVDNRGCLVDWLSMSFCAILLSREKIIMKITKIN